MLDFCLDTTSQEDPYYQQFGKTQLGTRPHLQTMQGTFGNANSPVQRLHLLEVSFVLSETMAQSNSALFSRIKWISGVNVAQSLKEGKERG
jgi:hypothetical protein